MVDYILTAVVRSPNITANMFLKSQGFFHFYNSGVYISKPPKDAKVAEDLIVSFFCEAFGDPRPRFHWEKNGKPLGTKQSRRYQVFDMPNGSVLRIEPVRGKRDNRTFTCVTKNDDDETRASASLLVYSSNGMFRPLIV